MEQRGFVFHEENLLSPADAVATFLARVALEPASVEAVPLSSAYGRVLAERMHADRDYPDAPRSAMDGFALRGAETPGRFRVDGEIVMGSVWGAPLVRGAAVRIPTGGVLPEGADAVVPVEDCRFDGGGLAVDGTLAAGENVNPAAGDMRAGEAVLEPGTRLGAPHVGVLATLGAASVRVFARPRIAVLSSGDELVPPSEVPGPGQVRDSNRFAVAAALRAMGAEPVLYPVVRDDPGLLAAALAEALARCEAVVVSGGSSVGERDATPAAIAAAGAPGVLVHGLRVKPGKPTVLGAAGKRPIIGLPGNPTSALVILEAVASPIVAALTGSRWRAPVEQAQLEAPVRSRRGWTWYVPVAIRHEGGALLAQPLALRSSSVSLAARADGFVVVPEDIDVMETGTIVDVHRFL
jgi:molybdenum cofactor synthesis domain-containing protein